MEDSGNEVPEVGTTLTETSGTIPQDADAKEGSYSRDFEADHTEYLVHGNGNETDIYGADQNMSIGAWYKREDETGTHHRIVSMWDTAAGNRQYLLGVVNTAGDNDPADFAVSSTGYNMVEAKSLIHIDAGGGWYHIVGVYDESQTDEEVAVYVNGYRSDDAGYNPLAHTAGIADKTADFVVGANYDGSATFADGLIDELFVMDRALSAAEVLDIYTNGFVQAEEGGKSRRLLVMQ